MACSSVAAALLVVELADDGSSPGDDSKRSE